MDNGVESLLKTTTENVGRQLHGREGTRDSKKFLRKVKPLIEGSIINDPKGEGVGRLELWLQNDPDGQKRARLNKYLDLSLGIYSASEQEASVSAIHFGVPGHDMENVVHTTTEVLRMIDTAGSDLGAYARWELLISGLNENLGRLIEGDDFTHDTTGFLLARAAIRTLEKDHGKGATHEERHIAKRILGNIHGHGSKNSGDPLSDLVKQSNRLQMVQPRFLRRSLEYDVAQVDQGILSLIDPERSMSIEHTIAQQPAKTPTSMDWGEFYVRNLFPFLSDSNNTNPELFKKIMYVNQERAAERKANSIAMLTILAGGVDTELFQQVFAPELGLVEPDEVHWTKKRIPDPIFQEGLRQYREFIAHPPRFSELDGKDNHEQISIMLEAMSSYLPQDMTAKINAKFDELDSAQQTRIIDALHHTLYLHYEELDKELAMLDRQVESDDLQIAKIARFAKKYLDSKKRLDK